MNVGCGISFQTASLIQLSISMATALPLAILGTHVEYRCVQYIIYVQYKTVSIDFTMRRLIHSDITVCMLGYHSNVAIKAFFFFLVPMTSCHPLQHAKAGHPSVFRHFNCPVVDDPNATCSTHCYSVAVERFRPNGLL